MGQLSIVMTGGSGYVGSYLALRLGALPSARLTLLEGDVTRPDLELPPADVVIHLAGRSSFAGGPTEIARVNLGGTVNLAQRCGPDVHFVFLSTDQVFASAPGRVYTEADPTAPETAYGDAKADAEAFLCATLPRVTILRTAVLYGYSHPRRHNTIELIASLLRAGAPVDLFNDVYACPTYLGDLAACVERVVTERLLGLHHACGVECLSRVEIGAALCAHYGYSPTRINPISRPPLCNVPRRLHLRPSDDLKDLLTTRLTTSPPL